MNPTTSCGTANLTLLCETFGVSRQALHVAKVGGRVKPASEGPSLTLVTGPEPDRAKRADARKGVPAEELMSAIREIVAEQPAWGVRKVWATLRRREKLVSLRRVHVLMRAANLVLARENEGRGDAAPRGHVVTALPNRRIAADFTTVRTELDGTVAVAIAVDCGCRSVLDVTVTKSQTSGAILASVDRAMERAFGSPEAVPDGVELRTDHGPQYTGRDAEELTKTWRVTHTFAPVGRPTGNAVAERTIRTMKEECIWLADWRDIDQLVAALGRWARTFNEDRPHQALGWQTPAERRAALLGPSERRAA
jgi:putative transposase